MLVKLGKEDFQKEDLSGHTIELYRPIQILVFFTTIITYIFIVNEETPED